MKILLDECLPLDFRHSFSRHDAHTAEWAGLKGKKNGDLLRCAEAAGYPSPAHRRSGDAVSAKPCGKDDLDSDDLFPDQSNRRLIVSRQPDNAGARDDPAG